MKDNKEPQETSDSDSTRMKRFVHFVLRPKIAIPLIVVMLLFAAPFAYRSSRINQLPDIDHPFDLEAFLNFEVPDEENAYVEYKQAVKLLVPMKGPWDEKAHGEIEDHGWSKATPAFQNWLSDNQPALAIWKEGTKKPNAQLIPYREMTIIGPEVAFISQLRGLSRLMHFQTMKLRCEKKYVEAWEWHRAWFRFSRHVGQNGSFTERMVGNAMLSFMKDSLLKWIRSSEVNVAMLKKALEEFESANRLTPNISRIIKAEYVYCEIFCNFLESDDAADSDMDLENAKYRILFYFRGEPELTRRILKHCFTNWLTQITKPRYRQTVRIPGEIGLFKLETKRQKEEQPPPLRLQSLIMSSEFGAILLTLNELMETSILRDQVNFQCLRIAIAAQIQLREHGTYPEKLEELKEILGEIPYDPFYSASRRDLQYRKEKDGFVVWSVGEDGFDNGGDIGTEDRAGRDEGFRIPKKN